MSRPSVHVPRHRRGVTRGALVTAVVALTAITVVQVLGVAHFAEEALSGRSHSWVLAGIALLGGGLGAALTIVAGQALALDLQTRPVPGRQDASRGQLDDDLRPPAPPRVPGQRDAHDPRPVEPPRLRSRGGVHRAGGH